MNQTPLTKLVSQLTSPQPRGSGINKNAKRKKTKNSSGRRRSNRATATVRGTVALGTSRQGPLQLTTEQFASYAPLSTFHVSAGTTPGGIRVRGRELVLSLNSGSSAVGGFGANNGTSAGTHNLNPSGFPRLNSYVGIYEYYKFHYAKAMFQSTRPTTTNGVAMLAVGYDVKDNPPTSSQGMMRNISSSMSHVYADNGCQVLGALSRLPRYATSEDNSSDGAQVNQAVFWYAFEGLASTEVNTPQGYLVVEYDVEFFTPQ